MQKNILHSFRISTPGRSQFYLGQNAFYYNKCVKVKKHLPNRLDYGYIVSAL